MRILKIPALFSVIFAFFLLISAPLAAEDGLRCTVSCKTDTDAPIVGMEFRIYRVASVAEDLSFAPTKEFADYAVVLNDLNAAETKATAETLAAYVARDKIMPLDRNVTDANGNAEFPKTVAELEQGLYLIIGSAAETAGKRYFAEPILIALPYQEPDDDAWLYDVMVFPKISEGTLTDHLSVVKIWKDNNASSRPKKVEVQLLKDGEVYDTQTLNAENNWRYTWNDLSPDCDWQIVEKEVPLNYTVLIGREGNTVSVTNTAQSGGGKDPSSGNSGGKLPQTGMLWWPIPILAIAGMVLLLLGMICRRGE